ncbi:MAG: two-component regulator propeller domain-containing protein, partial [bacterium]
VVPASSQETPDRTSKENDIWLGTDKGLACIRGDKITRYSVKDGMTTGDISGLFYDSDGNLWIGGTEGQLLFYRDGKFISKNLEKQGITSAITTMTGDSDKSIWIGTAEEGIFRYNPVERSVYIINTKRGLSSDKITVLLPDHEGNLLAGTQAGGLNRVRENLLKTYTQSDGLGEDQIMTLFCNNAGDVWAANSIGTITLSRDKKFTDYSSRFGLSGKAVYSICEGKDGRVWVAAEEALISLDAKGNKRIYPCHDKLSNTLFHAVYVARDGSVWAGTDAGIYIIRGEKITTLTLREGLTDEKIFCFFEDDKGEMWIGTQEGGINIYKDGKIRSITRNQGLSDNLILCFYQDPSGNMWVGTGHDGLNRIDGKSGEIRSFARPLGYPRMIPFIAEDQKGFLWMGCDNGILVVRKSDLESCTKESAAPASAYFIGPAEGMVAPCTGGTFPSGCRTRDGKIWFANEQGITVADPSTFHMPESDQDLFIADVLVNNESMGSSEVYDLSPGINHIEILYSAPGFTDPGMLNFRYRLENFDTGWIDAGARKSAFYTKLAPGNYTFRAGVRDYKGKWSSREAVIRIHVKPFYYQTWWFIGGCILAFILLIFFFMRYRLRQIREKELEILVIERTEEIRKLNEELEQKVIDRTAQLAATNTELGAFSYSVSHDLRAPVRRIEGLIQALTEDYADRLDQNAREFLSKISESVANMSQLIEELLKLSRIARQEIERTDVNISGMAKEICVKLKAANLGHPVDYRIQGNMILEADARLLQIAFQNLLDNCWKYTGTNENPVVEVGLIRQDGKDVIFVNDNGVGFDMNHYEKLFTPFQRLHSDDQFTGTGIGLATVKRIILKHGGTIRAESEPGKGTTFLFTLK